MCGAIWTAKGCGERRVRPDGPLRLGSCSVLASAGDRDVRVGLVGRRTAALSRGLISAKPP